MNLRDFIRQAELYGTASVYETAVSVLTPTECGYLTRHLRRVDRRWSLTPRQRARLVRLLIADGVAASDIADMCGLSLSRVYQVRNELNEPDASDPSPTQATGRSPPGTPSDLGSGACLSCGDLFQFLGVRRAFTLLRTPDAQEAAQRLGGLLVPEVACGIHRPGN